MHARRHSRGGVLSPSQNIPTLKVFPWATDVRKGGGEGSMRGGKGSVGLPGTVQTAVILLSPGLDNNFLHLALFWRNVNFFFTRDDAISSALREQP